MVDLAAGLQQRLDRCRVVSFASMPAVFGTMNCPTQWRAVEVGVLRFQRRIVFEDLTRHRGVAVKGRPMQRRRLMLSQAVNWKSCRQHRANSPSIVISRRMSDLASIR